MDDRPQPGQAFMSALVTEHFVLQSARSTTVIEAVGRMAVYLTCVPAAVIVGVAAALLVFGLQMMWMYRRGQHLMA